MMKRTLMAIALLALCVCASAGTLVSGKPTPGATTQYDLSVNSSGQHSPAHMAGERIEDSTTGTDYSSTSMECGMSAEIDLSGNTSTTIYNGPAILCGYTLSVTIGTAAVTIDDNTTAKQTLPVSWPVGYYGPMGAIFETSLVVNPADTSTGTLQLHYRPLDADSTWVP